MDSDKRVGKRRNNVYIIIAGSVGKKITRMSVSELIGKKVNREYG